MPVAGSRGRPSGFIAVLAASLFVAGGLAASASASAPLTNTRADVFNGRIAFSSFRSDPQFRRGDIFTMEPDGSSLRQLTTNPLDDAQSDWSPDGRQIAYRIRKPETPTTNFEVARMPAGGPDGVRLTFSPERQASSQPSWFPDSSGILFRRSAPGQLSGVWRMGVDGSDPVPFLDPPGPQLYPSFSPDMSRIAFTTTVSPTGDSDRAIQVIKADGTGLTTLFDVPGAYDSAPAWSPDGTRIAFESTADVAGGNPEGDMELWVMGIDGADPRQLTRNALHDEGPTWAPDGTLLAYSTGVDNARLDIAIMTTDGIPLRTLTDFAGRDESPDWQAIPAPDTDRRCGDLSLAAAPGGRDLRTAGLTCRRARRLATRWHLEGRPTTLGRFAAEVSDYGGTLRVVLSRTHRHRSGPVIAFLTQPDSRAGP